MLSSTSSTGATAEPPSTGTDLVEPTSRAPRGVPGQFTSVPQRAFVLIALTLFGLAAVCTLYFMRTMAAGMTMPGGWTMSMMWMPMPGQTLLSSAAVFTSMWLAMMVAMMLPSAFPMLLIYRRVMLFRGTAQPLQTWLVGAGYFAVWTAFGVLVYACGVLIARLTMRSEFASHLVPFACGVAFIVGGAWQFTPWKFACLRHCRNPLHLLTRHLDRGTRGGFRFGLHHGAYCTGCCWGLMLMMLALGVMNLAAMILVGGIIATEKLLARGEFVAHVVGVGAIVAGALLAARAFA